MPSPFRFAFCISFTTLLVAPLTHAQLRIVNYNTATAFAGGTQTARPEAAIVLEAIGEELVGGIARPIDVLILQEQFSVTGTTQSFVDMLNGIYGAGTYARSQLNAVRSAIDGAGGGPTLIYNTETIEYIGEVRFGTVNGSNQARSTMRYQLRPAGYGESADFYVYNNHYKAGDATDDKNRRQIEAERLRADIDGMGDGIHAIYAGDYNVADWVEPSFQTLIADGPGQAFDPADKLGRWRNNDTYARWHTQSPCENDCTGGFSGSGIDDRFDFQLVTGEFLDSEGLSYIPGSYHTFGNNGSTYNNAINDGNTIVFDGISSFTKMEVLNALESASDHLPVVADYQIPSMLEALAGSLPSTIGVGQNVNLDLFVRNAAVALASFGADELDFTFSTTGALSGSGAGTRLALAPAMSFPIALDTSTRGAKSGSIIVQSSSQGAGNAYVNIPVTFQVGEPTPTTLEVIARALYPNVADDVNVTNFAFGGTLSAVVPPSSLPSGSDAYMLAFSQTGDMFGIADRRDSPPGEMLDNTKLGSPSDSSGFIRSTDIANFFGITDTLNNDNTGPLTATWTFDISAALGDLSLSIDMAAMGDFEPTNDWVVFEASIDGSPFTTLFASTINDEGSQNYTMESGAIRTIVDPMLINGQLLTNSFTTFTSPLSGVGNQLTVRVSALIDGAGEVFAFRNLTISGLVEVDGLAGDYNGDGLVNLADYTVWRDTLGASVTEGTGADGNGDGVVNAEDYQLWKSHFGNSSGSVATIGARVPEPGTLLPVILAAVCFLLGRAVRK